MIRPPGWDGVAFSEGSDGDMRRDLRARGGVAAALGIRPDWGILRQVHGDGVIRVNDSGLAGEGDAMWTIERDLPLAVFTADCFGVVLHAADAVGVAHAGWRGAEAGVVASLRDEMAGAGHEPTKAAIGPGIGPCCFEVGREVSDRFPEHVMTTTWETTSVDLRAAVTDQLAGLEVWTSGHCTLHEGGWFSHRGNGTAERMATIGWLR